MTWVSAAEALDADGSLRFDLFGPYYTKKLEELARKNGPDECKVFRSSSSEHFEPTGTLDELTTHAKFIISGRVLAGVEGFLHFGPGTLFEIEADYLKGTPAERTFVFYPHSRIVTNEGLICAAPVIQPRLVPEPGDRLLAFSMTPATVTPAGNIFVVNLTRELVLDSRRRGTYVPETVRNSSGRPDSLDAVRRAATEILVRAKTPQ